MDRRNLLGGGILGGLIGALEGEELEASEAAAQQRQASPEDIREIVTALNRLRQQVADQRNFSEIGTIRDAQRSFLRVNQKMPDFIEVGATYWFQLYDWHVRWQQPLNLGRDSQGRYTILFMGTTVILRAENPDAYLSAPYDLE
jgi:hypothetical protein